MQKKEHRKLIMKQKINNMKIKNLQNQNNFFLIAGPCIVENEEITFQIAEKIKEITQNLNIPFIFKASFRKANRSKSSSFTGIGDEKALKILQKIKQKYSLPIITDIHTEKNAEMAANYDIDILQIPAFLSRQTDLLIAAGKTNKIINIKKGQFMSASAMKLASEKVLETGNNQIMLTERGSFFGYSDLVVDYRNIYEMKQFGYPVILDATHSLQQPNQQAGITGGKPELIETIAKAGIATGIDGLFIETHPSPQNALSDGANMLELGKLKNLLEKLVKLYKINLCL